MRLINTKSLELEDHFFENVKGQYAILSHTWGDGEVTFRDMCFSDPVVREKLAWQQKILPTCTEARHFGLSYAWVDTCCIDKSSSSELSEAINSMYKYYKEARVCYVYMSDVACLSGSTQMNALLAYEQEAPPEVLSESTISQFRASRWFKRGWTLQELLAPEHLRFYSQGWIFLGQTKPGSPQLSGHSEPSDTHTASASLIELLSSITAVPELALAGVQSVHAYSIAQRMSWAAERSTTRKEDEAYCLLGLFDINIPLLYGEGARAFRRLQEAIIKETDDQSIFAWQDSSVWGIHEDDMNEEYVEVPSQLFAPSPRYFASCGDIVTWKTTDHAPSYHLTNRGLEIALFHPKHVEATPKQPRPKVANRKLAILQCKRADDFSNGFALYLSRPTSLGDQQVVRQYAHALHRRQRRTEVSLGAEDMIGPIRATILARVSNERMLFDLPTVFPVQLVVEYNLPKPVEFTRLDPISQWNKHTLVMTTTTHLRDWDLASAFKSPRSATMCFEYDSQPYIILVHYYRLGGQISITRAASDTSQTQAELLKIARPPICAKETIETNGTKICCTFEMTSRLGRHVMVVSIGLTSELARAESPEGSQYERKKQQAAIGPKTEGISTARSEVGQQRADA